MDTDKIQGFFIHHIEKMILVGIIGGAGFLLYQGWQKPDFLAKHQPDRLGTDATEVKSDIDVNHNDAILPERQPTFNIVQQTRKLYTVVEPSAYKLEKTWEGLEQQSVVRRQDPVLAAPKSIVTSSVATVIAVRGSTSDDPTYALASLEPADPVEKIEKKTRAPRRSRRRGGMGDEMGMGMEEMMGMGDEMGMGMESMMGMEDMMGMEGMGEGAMGSGRMFNSKFDFGLRPTATTDKRKPEPKAALFIAGRAVVPHKQLYEAYEMAFADASQYDPRRDTPFYYNLEVQRADVTDKPLDQLDEEDWVKIWDRTLYTKLAAFNWSGFAPEIVPRDYRDDALTMWIPPVLLDDYRPYVKHPLVPMLPHEELKRLLDPEEDTEEVRDFSFDDAETGLVNPGERGTGLGGGAEMMDYDMDEMDMGEMEGGMGMGMMAMFTRGAIEKDPVDYKLIRFYDFAGFRNSPTFGRKYVYRIRYAVNDPNFPFSQTLQPKTSSLAPEVALRVEALQREAMEKNRRTFERWSEWSEPSDPVSLPDPEHYFVGPVTPPSVNVGKVGGRDVEFMRDLPTAKIVASQIDLKLGTRIPFQLDVTEGSVLSHKAESADVVDPITLQVKKLPDAEIISGTTIISLGGGAPLEITEELPEPSMMLLFDQDGTLTVTDSVDDLELYRIYSYADERGEE